MEPLRGALTANSRNHDCAHRGIEDRFYILPPTRKIPCPLREDRGVAATQAHWKGGLNDCYMEDSTHGRAGRCAMLSVSWSERKLPKQCSIHPSNPNPRHAKILINNNTKNRIELPLKFNDNTQFDHGIVLYLREQSILSQLHLPVK